MVGAANDVGEESVVLISAFDVADQGDLGSLWQERGEIGGGFLAVALLGAVHGHGLGRVDPEETHPFAVTDDGDHDRVAVDHSLDDGICLFMLVIGSGGDRSAAGRVGAAGGSEQRHHSHGQKTTHDASVGACALNGDVRQRRRAGGRAARQAER